MKTKSIFEILNEQAQYWRSEYCVSRRMQPEKLAELLDRVRFELLTKDAAIKALMYQVREEKIRDEWRKFLDT